MEKIYHVFNKSIAEFKIFINKDDISRIIKVIRYYQRENPPIKFSEFCESCKFKETDIFPVPLEEKLIEIIAYCIMPTHLHFILRELKEHGIARFTKNILDSYSRYFNIRYGRKGPLWEGRCKKVLIQTEDQLLHLTRYIHLNPVTTYLVDKPEEWQASSYREYLLEAKDEDKFCNFNELIDINPSFYRKFVEFGITYQRERAKNKNTDKLTISNNPHFVSVASAVTS